ncbi:MAG: hypothetical protein FWD78_08060, partial [Treponema sp.]|nr:hypothetical protein [Treponema sp.]
FVNPDGVFAGWPNDTTMSKDDQGLDIPLVDKYYIRDMIEKEPKYARFPAYSEVTGLNTVTGLQETYLNIRYYDKSSGRETDAGNLFSTWCPDGTINITPTESTNKYNKSIYDGSLNRVQQYYNVNITKDLTLKAGWPDRDKREQFGLSQGDVYDIWDDMPPQDWENFTYKYFDGLTPDPYNNNIIPKPSLTLRFYKNFNIDSIKPDYFSEAWEAVDSTVQTNNIKDYTRGGFRASFNETNSGTYHYHDITFTERDDCKLKWPGIDVRTKYGLIQDSPWLDPPTSTKYMTYSDSDDYPSTGKPSSLTIRFYGTTDPDIGSGRDLENNYFYDWFAEGPGTYSRSDNNLSYSMVDPAAANTYYQLVFTKNSKTTGWPASNILESYGLHGMTTTMPADVDFVTYEMVPGSTTRTLKIRYYAGSSVNEVSQYFRDDSTYKPGNNWVFNIDENSLDLRRGYANAVITRYQPSSRSYYDLDVTFTIPGTQGWPTSNLTTYGLGNMSQFTNVLYPSYVVEPTDKYGQYLTLRFYRTFGSTDTAIETAITNYFSTNGWVLNDSSTADILNYTKASSGLSNSVNIDFTYRPFYTIRISNSCIKDGWPDATIRGDFGLTNSCWTTVPSNFSNISYIYWDGNTPDPYNNNVKQPKSLTIRFTASANTQATIPADYFYGAWEVTGTNTQTFTRGSIKAVFDETDSLNGNFQFIFTPRTDCKPGWPDSATMTAFGLTNSAWASEPTSEPYTVYTYNPGTSLNIRFYGSGSAQTDVTGYYFDDTWELTSESTSTKFVYTRGGIRAIFEIFDTADPSYFYYQLTFTPRPATECQTGWPSSTILSNFGLTNSAWSSIPTSYPYITYVYNSTGTKTLTIRFYGSANSGNDLTTQYFDSSWTIASTQQGITTYTRAGIQATYEVITISTSPNYYYYQLTFK